MRRTGFEVIVYLCKEVFEEEKYVLNLLAGPHLYAQSEVGQFVYNLLIIQLFTQQGSDPASSYVLAGSFHGAAKQHLSSGREVVVTS